MIGFLPTHPTLPGHLRPVEYLELLGKVCRLPAEVRKPRLTSLLRAVGLLDATDQRIDTFSTGMRTRLGIAASLMADPPLLLWDEPTAGLDPAARRFTLDLIRDLGKTRTILVATHILSDIDQICDHVGVMYEGRMIFSGPMREMKRRLQRDEYSLEVEGPPEALSRAAQQADQLPDVDRASRRSAHAGGAGVRRCQPRRRAGESAAVGGRLRTDAALRSIGPQRHRTRVSATAARGPIAWIPAFRIRRAARR